MKASLVAIDTKNLALYGRGISGFVKPLIVGWLFRRPQTQFVFVGPTFNAQPFAGLRNWKHHRVAWPGWLPRVLRHPFYDNCLFPMAVSKLGPDLVLSPYHDVLLPSKSQARSIMTVHDTCMEDLAALYPRRLRKYYCMMLERNLRRSTHVLTVSEASRSRIIRRHQLRPDEISVIYNMIDPVFEYISGEDHRAATEIRSQFRHYRIVVYPGGSEWRKNIPTLLDAFDLILASDDRFRLLVTGERSSLWNRALRSHPRFTCERVYFLGDLTSTQLKAHYLAADAVVYPSLCEGFGRVCLEAMAVGTPLACSNLEVLREVCGDYAMYFNPKDTAEIARTVKNAVVAGRLMPRLDDRFLEKTVISQFTAVMDRFMPGAIAEREAAEYHE